MPQYGPHDAQRGPKNAPRRLQEASETSREALRGLQEGKRAPGGLQEGKNNNIHLTEGPRKAPRGPQEGSRRLQEGPSRLLLILFIFLLPTPSSIHQASSVSSVSSFLLRTVRLSPSLLQHFSDHLNSPGHRFWMGWWGYAKRLESIVNCESPVLFTLGHVAHIQQPSAGAPLGVVANAPQEPRSGARGSNRVSCQSQCDVPMRSAAKQITHPIVSHALTCLSYFSRE